MVSALAKLLRDKSTDGGLSSHGGKVEIDEVKMSFCLKPIADKSVLTRRPERADLVQTFVEEFRESLVESAVSSWVTQI